MAALISQIEIATEITPALTVSIEGEPSPWKRAIIEYLKPTFTIRSEMLGDYVYAPYGKSEGSWLIPLLLGALIWGAVRRR